MKGSRWNIDLADQALARSGHNPLRGTVASAGPAAEEEAVQGVGHIVQREADDSLLSALPRHDPGAREPTGWVQLRAGARAALRRIPCPLRPLGVALLGRSRHRLRSHSHRLDDRPVRRAKGLHRPGSAPAVRLNLLRRTSDSRPGSGPAHRGGVVLPVARLPGNDRTGRGGYGVPRQGAAPVLGLVPHPGEDGFNSRHRRLGGQYHRRTREPRRSPSPPT